MKLTNSLKKRFVKECGLPINVFQEPNFTENIILIDKTHNSKKLLKDFMDLLKDFPNEDLLIKEFNRVNQTLQEYMKNEFYEFFCNKDFKVLTDYVKETKQNFKFTKNLYIE